jgi:hypothetical protein
VNVRATRDVERLPWVTSVLGPGAAVGAGVLGGGVAGGVATGVRPGVGAGVAGGVGSTTGVRAGVGLAVGGMVGLAAGVGMAEGTADGLPAAVGGTLAGAWDGDPGTDGDGGAAAVQATTAAASTATRIRAVPGGRHRAAGTRVQPALPRATVIEALRGTPTELPSASPRPWRPASAVPPEGAGAEGGPGTAARAGSTHRNAIDYGVRPPPSRPHRSSACPRRASRWSSC